MRMHGEGIQSSDEVGRQGKESPVAVEPAVVDEKLREDGLRIRVRDFCAVCRNALAELLAVCLYLLHRPAPA